MIYAHGGNCCSMSAKDEMPFLCKLADQNNMIFASVEFRNSPETKLPGAAEDMATVIDHVWTNGSNIFNADVNRLCIGGSNGGAHVCLSTAILMAKKGNSSTIKA